MEYHLHFTNDHPVARYFGGDEVEIEAKVVNLWDHGMEIEGGVELRPDDVVRLVLQVSADQPPFVMEGQVRGNQTTAGKTRTVLVFLTVETPRAYEHYLIQAFYDSFAA